MKSVNEVSGFGSLRWEDQERIKKKLAGAGADSTDGPAPSKKKRKTTRSDLSVEYAKSNRSSCKGCNSQINKVGGSKPLGVCRLVTLALVCGVV